MSINTALFAGKDIESKKCGTSGEGANAYDPDRLCEGEGLDQRTAFAATRSPDRRHSGVFAAVGAPNTILEAFQKS